MKDDEQSREQQGCRWMEEMQRKVKQEKFPDYLEDAGRLYRRIPHSGRALWKLCVPTGQRKRVMTENYDMPTAGHLESSKTIARIAARYHWP